MQRPKQLAWEKFTDEIAACGAETPLPEKIRLWYDMGGNMQAIAKMSVAAIIMPTTQTIRSMERRGYLLIEDLKEALQPLRLQYQQLTYKDLDDFYDGDTASLGPGNMLDLMESFHRLTPIHKFGQVHTRCCCPKGFRNLACHHSALLSVLWDPEVQVPSSLSLVPIPRRKGKVVPTAFNVDKVIEDEEVPGPAPVWQPKIAGREDPVTPPPAKRSKHEQQRKVVRAVDSDLGEEASGNSKIGRRKLVLEARSASQPVKSVPYAFTFSWQLGKP